MAQTNVWQGGLFRGKRTVWLLCVLALVIFLTSGWAWWHYVRSNPQRVFNAMLDNNLKVSGVTDHLIASNGVQTLDQNIQLVTNPSHIAHASTILSQTGDNAASVKTETIGTNTADYVRYLDVTTGDKNTANKQLDFSSVKNVWGKKTVVDDIDPSKASGELYSQTILSVIPIGNLPFEARKQLINQIRQEEVFTVDYSKVQKSIKNGRPVYVYSVMVKPDAYVNMLKSFAKNFPGSVGLQKLDQVDPASYAGGDLIPITVSVDVWSQQLTGIDYQGGSRVETLSAFGGQFRPQVPKETIPIQELQSRVQALQQ